MAVKVGRRWSTRVQFSHGKAARDWFGCLVQARLAESGWYVMVRQSGANDVRLMLDGVAVLVRHGWRCKAWYGRLVMLRRVSRGTDSRGMNGETGRGKTAKSC